MARSLGALAAPRAVASALVRSLPLVLALVVASALVLAPPWTRGALAHTDLLQGSPGPAQRVGGTVDFIDLVFLGPVGEAVVEVTNADGEVIPGEMEVADGQIIRHRMEPLTEPGIYVVRYRVRSEDGDDTSGMYSFSYEPGALEPTPFGANAVAEAEAVAEVTEAAEAAETTEATEATEAAETTEASSAVWTPLVSVAVGLLVGVCVVLAISLAVRLRQRRAQLAGRYRRT